jgi:uncharacterized protein (DUF2252 family)
VPRKFRPEKSIAPEGRAAALAEERNRKMAASAHAYVRGSTEKFYHCLGDSKHAASLPIGPDVWICGDCHAGNLGPLAAADGGIAVQIRDLDQSVIGNPAHDLIRLALSLAMAARGSDLPGITTAYIIERMVAGYEEAFESDAEKPDTADEMPKMARVLLHEASRRSWKHLADERIEGITPEIPLGKRFWPLIPEERSAIDALFEQENTRQLVTALRSRSDEAPVRVLDAAYWRKGCSSLGGLRFAVLAAVDTGKAERHCLVDIKQAVQPAAPHSPTADMPKDNAERVVTGARHLSPYLGQRMLADKLLRKSIFIRELRPQDLKLEIERLSQQEAMEMAKFLAHVIGRAHARQLGNAERKSWLVELRRNRTKSLDAPNWLWLSVVDLVSTHEGAYLNHCRRYAMQDTA